MGDTLKGKIVRLAHARPEYRSELLGLLRPETRTAKILWNFPNKWEGQLEGPNVRIRWGTSPGLIFVEQMPGKPVQRRVRRSGFEIGHVRTMMGRNGGSLFWPEQIVKDARLSGSMTYDQVVQAIFAELVRLFEQVKANYGIDYESYGYPKAAQIEEEVSYLQVEPASYEPIQLQGKGFGGKIEWESFRLWREGGVSDPYGEGMSDFYKEQSPGGARKLFKIVSARGDQIRNMTWEQFTAMLDKAKIAWRYVPSQWR